jgi:DNA repair ATPase RecN
VSDRDHTFTVEHVVLNEWTRLGEAGDDQVGPAIYTFKVEVKSKKTAHQEVEQERVYQDHSMVVAKLDYDVLRKFVAHPAPAAKVKDALQQVLDKGAKLAAASQQLTEAKSDLKILADDQARVRENLKIIPQTSEHYKDFLKKFVAQEAQIEEGQRQIRTQEAAVQKLQKEYDAFVTGLSVQ